MLPFNHNGHAPVTTTLQYIVGGKIITSVDSVTRIDIRKSERAPPALTY